MGIDTKSQREQTINLVSGNVLQVNFDDTLPNVFNVYNKMPGVIYIGASPNITSSNYDLSIDTLGAGVFVYPKGTHRIYLLSVGTSGTVKILSYESDDTRAGDLQKFSTTTFTGPLPAGANIIGQVTVTDGFSIVSVNTDGGLDMHMTNPIPSGTNIIGNVGITSGINPIGGVYITDMTNTATIDATTKGLAVKVVNALPTGANTIGHVGLDSGANLVGGVFLSDGVTPVPIDSVTGGLASKIVNPLPSGTNDVGNVNVSGYGDTVEVSFTRPSDTTLYTANDVVGTSGATNMVFASVVPSARPVIIAGAYLRINASSVPSGMSSFKLHLYNAAPTAISDNAAFNVIDADRTKYLGYLTFNTPEKLGDNLLMTQIEGVNMVRKLTSTSIFGVLQTSSAYTPTSACVIQVGLAILGR